MYKGIPDTLTRAEAAHVDAQLSSNPECMCILCRARFTDRLTVFKLLDRDREREAELSEQDAPESE